VASPRSSFLLGHIVFLIVLSFSGPLALTRRRVARPPLCRSRATSRAWAARFILIEVACFAPLRPSARPPVYSLTVTRLSLLLGPARQRASRRICDTRVHARRDDRLHRRRPCRPAVGERLPAIFQNPPSPLAAARCAFALRHRDDDPADAEGIPLPAASVLAATEHQPSRSRWHGASTARWSFLGATLSPCSSR